MILSQNYRKAIASICTNILAHEIIVTIKLDGH